MSMSAVSDQLSSLEHSAYEWQLKVFDSHIDILTEEEQSVHSAIDNIKQQIAGTFTFLHPVHFLSCGDKQGHSDGGGGISVYIPSQIRPGKFLWSKNGILMVIDLIIYIIIPPPKSSTMSFENLYPFPQKIFLATPLEISISCLSHEDAQSNDG